MAAYTFRRNAHLLRTDRWAYMRYDQGGEELYDMQRDRSQFRNLARVKEYARPLADLRRLLDAKIEDLRLGSR